MKANHIPVLLVLSAVLVGVVLITGCLDYGYVPATDTNAITPSNSCSPIDYNHGVYYFPCVASTFGNSIAIWKTSHPDQIILTITADDTQSQGYTKGYFVITEPRGDCV